MHPTNPKDAFRGLCLFFIVLGLGLIVISLLALKHGTTVSFGRDSKIQVSPWVSMIISIGLLVFGIVGLRKISKHKNKDPF
jgi:hypothetical protein